MRLPRSVPYIAQMEVAECGPACLAMLLARHGRHVPLSELRREMGVGRDGSSLGLLLRTARAQGLDARALRVTPTGLTELSLPLIAHWEGNHFVVIERVSARAACIVDPALGRRQLTPVALAEGMTGAVLTAKPGASFELRTARSASLSRYLRALFESPRALALVVGSACLLEVSGLFVPAINQVLIDHVIPSGRTRWLWGLLVTLAGVTLSRAVFLWLRDRTLSSLRMALDLRLMTRYVDHLLALPASFFAQRTPGDLMARVDANRTLSDLTARLIGAGLDALLILGLGALTLVYHRGLGALTLAFAGLRLGLLAATQGRAREIAATELVQRGREASARVEALASPETVRALRLAPLLADKHELRTVQRLNAELSSKRYLAAVTLMTQCIDGAALAAVVGFGGRAVLAQEMSLGAFVGFLTLQALLNPLLESLLQALAQLAHARGILARMADVLEASPEPSGERAPPRLRGEIELRGVCFRYGPGAAPACSDVHLSIAAGETVAIVGPSGAGKSTLAKLLCGLLQPTSGRIFFDGQPLETLDLKATRAQLGVVLQEPFVLDASVRANLDLNQRGLPDRALVDALRVARLEGLLERLARGLDSRLGERGNRLSGGERQRLSLARALVAEPAILLLDEATSSLDRDTEAALQAGVAELRCTRVLIAHRLSTVANADRVVVMEAGRIVQVGSFADLARAPGLFRQLLLRRTWEAQP